MTEAPNTYAAQIEKMLSDFGYKVLPIPDQTNSGKFIGEFFLWSTVRKYAEKKEKAALEAMKTAEIYDDVATAKKEPGTYQVAASRGFAFNATVTAPTRRFNQEKFLEFATEWINKNKKKIEAAKLLLTPGIIRVWLEDAKIGETPQVRKAIVER